MPKHPVIAMFIDSDEIMRVTIDLAKKQGWVPLDISITGDKPLSWMSPQLGLILPEYANEHYEIWSALVRTGCHIVIMGWGDAPSTVVWPMVLSDQAASGRLAAEHYFERGFTSVGYVGSDPWGGSRQLYEAFAEASAEQGMSCHLLRLRKPGRSEGSVDDGWRMSQFKAWIGSVPKPVGLLSWGFKGGTMLCEMCHQLGFAVPDDVSILVAGDDSLRCECAPVPLSCIGIDRLGMASKAIGILADMLAGRDVPSSPVLIPSKAISCRESTSVLAVRNRGVARALRYIWGHYDLDVGVEHIATAVGVPVRTLQRAFKQELGRGVNAELRRKRLERVCELLRTTDLTIAAIGKQVGIRSRDHLHSSFRRAYGMSPREYRLQSKIPDSDRLATNG